MDSPQIESTFKRNDVIFAVCNNELPWPAQLTKINEDKYSVKFIGHKSHAIVKKDKLIPFTEEYIVEIIKEYKAVNQDSLVKVLRAIDQARTVAEKNKKKEVREINKSKKAKTEKQPKAEKPKSERSTSTRTRNQSKKQIIAEEIQVKIKEQESAPELSFMQEKVEEPVVQLPQEVKLENMVLPEQNINEEEPEVHNNPIIELQQKEESPISSMIHEIKPAQYGEEEEIISNSYISEAEINEQEYQQIPESQSNNPQLQIVIPIEYNIENNAQYEDNTETEVHRNEQAEQEQQSLEYKGPVQFSEMKTFQPVTPIDKVCHYLQKMINYLGRLVFEPLKKEEKEELAELLKNHRRVHESAKLLDHMVRFIQAFDFKLKEERKKCFIEYIKIKERVECCCVFRSQLTYDEEINKILDRYMNRFNIQ